MDIDYIERGDCLELMKDIPEESIDLILTDIPYNISRESNFFTMNTSRNRVGLDFGEWDKGFNENQLKVLQDKLKKGGSIVVFHAREQFSTLQEVFDKLTYKDTIVWKKTNPMPRNRDRRYIVNIEHASWYVKPGDKWTFNRQNDNYYQCVLEYPSESGGAHKRYHPTQKPQALLEELLKRHSNPGDVVLDPYMGGGSTCVACVNTGRHYIGFEKEPEYFDAACARLDEVEQVV